MKKILLLILIIFITTQTVFAEKISVRITPTQVISTNHDEIEMGDWISFVIVNDVYVEDKIYIKKDTPIYGYVDFFHENGWAGDGSEIRFKQFKTIDAQGNKLTIESPLIINGNSPKSNDVKQYISWHDLIFFDILRVSLIALRGSEIFIEPDETVYNLFINR